MDPFEDVDDGETPVIDPYGVLKLERTATADQVKAAYRKAALQNHPGKLPFSTQNDATNVSGVEDKVAEDKKVEAHEKFQAIAFAYAVLSDPIRRKRYDATGSTSESIVDSDGFSWRDFYREQYQDAVSADAIKAFAKKYKDSDEEKDDILVAYEQAEGDMDAVYESVMLSNVLEDDDRFRGIIDEAIANGDVPPLTKYTKESKRSKQARIKAAQGEAAEAEDYAKELGVHDKLFGSKTGKGKNKKDSSEDALAALIKRRQDDRSGFLDRLAEKYAGDSKPRKGKKRSADEDEPSEEAFQAAAARLTGKKVAAGSSTGTSKKSRRG